MVLHDPFDEYLATTSVINADHPELEELVNKRGWADLSELERARAIFEFVRDEVRHSWDAQDEVVTCTASEVLEAKTGICYAKSHLLAGLLRFVNVPAGFCYQRLTLFDDPKDGFSVHALNGLYLASLNRWIRVDARGNNSNVHTDFGVDLESLAFKVRPELGEIDYPGVYAHPNAKVLEALRTSEALKTVYAYGLPECL